MTKTEQQIREKSLYEAILAIEPIEECEGFLKDLCTPAEITAFADRWCAAKHVHQGLPYRKITEETGVSTATVTRVARFLHHGYNGYKSILEKTQTH